MQTTYKGSIATATHVATQIAERFGKDEVAKYDPNTNCMTLAKWNEYGYKVKKGEKSLISISMVDIEKKDKKTGKLTGLFVKVPRTVHLFYYLQVEKKVDAK